MARALLIYNPAAARTRSSALESICAVFGAAGWSVEVADTAGPGDAAEMARGAATDHVDVVAVYGGDGTTIQAVGGLMSTGLPVGLIPGGTGNLLAGNLRLPRNPVQAARVIVRGAPKRIDLGRMECGGVSRYFAVGCGAGLDAELMAGTTGLSKRRWGMAAYVAKATALLWDPTAVGHRVTVDGKTLEMDAIWLMVANCREIIPPFLCLGPGIALDDGLLDVVAVNAGGLVESAGVVMRLVAGRPNGSHRVRYARGRAITVESDRPRPTELDGEPVGVTPFTAEVIPGGMSVMLPRSG